jgi:hypothetical protein
MNVKKFAAGAALAITATLIPITGASADIKPTESQNYKDEVEKYKVDFAIFRLDLQRYEEARRIINATFKLAIERALSESRSSETSAMISQSQRRQNAASKRGAVALATAQRDIAIAELGEGPTPPPQPAKPGSFQKNKKAPKPPR